MQRRKKLPCNREYYKASRSQDMTYQFTYNKLYIVMTIALLSFSNMYDENQKVMYDDNQIFYLQFTILSRYNSINIFTTKRNR